MPEQEFLLKEAISKLLYPEKSRLEFFNIHTSSDQNSLLFLFFFFLEEGGGEPSLCITSTGRDQGRDILGETDSIRFSS